jgi:hypothetical protein
MVRLLLCGGTGSIPGSAGGSRAPQWTYDDTEWSVILQAAALEELKPTSFVSLAALDAARVRVTGVLLDRGMLAKLMRGR